MTRLASIFLIVALLSLSIPAQASQAEPAVLVVDLELVFAECRACQTAKAEFVAQKAATTGRMEQLFADFKAKVSAIETAQQDIDRAPAAERFQAAQALGADMTQIREMSKVIETFREDETARFNELEADIMRQYRAALAPVLETIRKERGALAVLDSGSVLALASGVDVTGEATTRIDAALSVITLPPPPPLPSLATE